jgi:hypothetical protein
MKSHSSSYHPIDADTQLPNVSDEEMEEEKEQDEEFKEEAAHSFKFRNRTYKLFGSGLISH